MYLTKYENVVVELSDGSMIKGKLNIRNHNRLSDYLRHAEDQFVVIVSKESGQGSEKVFFINRDYIVRVTPDELTELKS